MLGTPCAGFKATARSALWLLRQRLSACGTFNVLLCNRSQQLFFFFVFGASSCQVNKPRQHFLLHCILTRRGRFACQSVCSRTGSSESARRWSRRSCSKGKELKCAMKGEFSCRCFCFGWVAYNFLVTLLALPCLGWAGLLAAFGLSLTFWPACPASASCRLLLAPCCCARPQVCFRFRLLPTRVPHPSAAANSSCSS